MNIFCELREIQCYYDKGNEIIIECSQKIERSFRFILINKYHATFTSFSRLNDISFFEITRSAIIEQYQF